MYLEKTVVRVLVHGVFICIKGNLSVSAIPSLDTVAEIIWAKIDILKRNPILICSFYRPPNNLLQPFVKLHESLSELLNSNVSLPCIILAGDFNLPSIYWSDGSGQLQSNPVYGHEINFLFRDVINDCSLEQCVTSPTRGSNTLDLTFSSQSIISDTSIVPGMSDHEAVLFTIHLKAKILHTKLDQKIFLYHKGNINGVKADMVKVKDMFMSNNSCSIELFKTTGIFSSYLCLIVSVNMSHKNPSNPSVIYPGSIMR